MDNNTKLSQKTLLNTIIGLVIIFILAIVGVIIFFQNRNKNTEPIYNALFLQNGQVYFGKIANDINSPYVKLEDVYYIKVNQDKNDVQIVPLGSEIHKPKSSMKINKDQILFIQELESDSQIIDIVKNKKPGTSLTNPSQPSVPTQPTNPSTQPEGNTNPETPTPSTTTP